MLENEKNYLIESIKNLLSQELPPVAQLNDRLHLKAGLLFDAK
jgi:hypothetical protein